MVRCGKWARLDVLQDQALKTLHDDRCECYEEVIIQKEHRRLLGHWHNGGGVEAAWARKIFKLSARTCPRCPLQALVGKDWDFVCFCCLEMVDPGDHLSNTVCSHIQNLQNHLRAGGPFKFPPVI